MAVRIERVSIGVPEIDRILAGGIPKGFVVAITGEPGTGKTVLCLHFAEEGLRSLEKCIFVTTEESSSSIITQAAQFGFDFKKAVDEKRLIIIDALMRSGVEPWTLRSLDPEELINKIIEAKKALGYGPARCIIDSMSAFWLSAPAMARSYSYMVKKVLSQWGFTGILLTSQYAVTTAEAFGFGVEHIADGLIRFYRRIVDGRLHRYIICLKLRQTPHDLRMYEIDIKDGKGLVVLGPVERRREDVALPSFVAKRIIESRRKKERVLEGSKL